MSPKFRNLIIVFLISAFLLPSSGCKLNKTLKKITTAVTKISVILKLPPGVTTTAAFVDLILEIKKSDDPNTDPNSLDPNSIEVDPDNHTATIFLDRKDTNDPNLHVGLQLKEPGKTDLEIVGTYVKEGGNPWVEVASAPNLKTRQDSTLGRVLDVTNPSGIAVRVTSLEVAVSNINISLGGLNYYDTTISGLPWYSVISTPTDFTPGETKTFDVPDDSPFIGFCYARALYCDTAESGPEGDVVYAFAVLKIPTLSEWGLIIMAGLLLTVGAVVIWRRFRMVSA
ncbi:MAG: hypothetical protein CVV39_00335 [Planctomycetes bacterium HGW-Planctomycetes-1]|nr:MAG: hypothetical protein CVV39_00335 [Planctomycetes bacterium HGW-Planctomycetes-1]